MPSTTNPGTCADIARWNARTAASVFRPNTPSAVSVCPPELFRKLIWSCTARTAGPLLPRFTATTSAFHVPALTTPLAGRWRECWNAITAAFVLAPKEPSTTSLAPCAFSKYCSDRMVTCGHRLLRPSLRTGHGCNFAAPADASVTTDPAALAVDAGDTKAGT